MEGAAGLQLACNIIELIKTTRDVITIGQTIRHGGNASGSLLQEAQQLNLTSQKLQSTLLAGSASGNPEDPDLYRQCQEVSNCAKQLEDEASKYSSTSSLTKPGRWKAFVKGTRYVAGGHEKLAGLSAQLQRQEQHLNMQVNLRLSRHSNELRVASNTTSTQLNLVLMQISALQLEVTKSNTDRDKQARLSEQRINRHKVLSSLFYGQMQSRKDSIPLAYHETFEWVFEPPHHGQWGSSLSAWFQQGMDRCFWISGKPGSGKSTLMRFVEGHEKLRRLLDAGQPSRRTCVASFYFWKAGSSMQASIAGALRTLCHTIVSQEPEVIPIVFGADFHEGEWTYRSLCETLLSIMEASKHAWVFFLDALDESLDDREDLRDFLAFLQGLDHCRLICSSRPEQRFEIGFAKSPSIRLQDLTRGDIGRFIEGKLGNTLMSATHLTDYERQDIIWRLVDNADGVFLWARLVTSSIDEGLEAFESYEEIMARVAELPSDLDQMFAHMMSKLPPRFKEEAEIYFQLTIAAREADMQISLLQASAIDLLCGDLRGPPRKALSIEDLIQHKHVVEVFLRVRCAGLIEVRTYQDYRGTSSYIDFTHRSAYEYLTGRFPSQCNSESSLRPFELMMQAQIALLDYADINAEAAAAVEQHSIPETFYMLHGTPTSRLRQTWQNLEHSAQAFVERRNLVAAVNIDPSCWIVALETPIPEPAEKRPEKLERGEADKRDAHNADLHTKELSSRHSAAEYILPFEGTGEFIVDFRGYLVALGFEDLLEEILSDCTVIETTYLAMCCVQMWRRVMGGKFVGTPGVSPKILKILLEKGVEINLTIHDVLGSKAREWNGPEPQHLPTLFSMITATIVGSGKRWLDNDREDMVDGVSISIIRNECFDMLSLVCDRGGYDVLGVTDVRIPLSLLTGSAEHDEWDARLIVNLTAYACILASLDPGWRYLADLCWATDDHISVHFVDLITKESSPAQIYDLVPFMERLRARPTIQQAHALANIFGSLHCPYQTKDEERLMVKRSLLEYAIGRTRIDESDACKGESLDGLVGAA